MVSIDDFSPNRPLPQPLKNNGPQQVDVKSPDGDHNTAKEDLVPTILAKASVAAKLQIISGMGNYEKPELQPGPPSGSTDDFGDFSKAQREFGEDDMALNLKDIVADDSRWESFSLGALGLPPNTESCNTVRDCLLSGFREGAWDGIANLVELYSKSAGTKKNATKPSPSDSLSAGLIERTKLWLTFPTYFETLFSAVQKKSLPQEMNLYTSELLIRYLGTIGQ